MSLLGDMVIFYEKSLEPLSCDGVGFTILQDVYLTIMKELLVIGWQLDVGIFNISRRIFGSNTLYVCKLPPLFVRLVIG